MTGADVEAGALQARLINVLADARVHLGYARSRALAARFALDLVRAVLDADDQLATAEVLAAYEAAEACVAGGFTRSRLATASYTPLPVLSLGAQSIYAALDVGHPNGAALAAIRFALDQSFEKQAAPQLYRLEEVVMRCSCREAG